MGSTPTNTTTTTQNRDPWSAASPYLQDVMRNASGLYNTQNGGTVYGGPTQAPLNNYLTNSFDRTAGIAGQDTSQPYQYAMNSFGNMGLTPGMMGPMGTMGDISTGSNSLTTGSMYNNLYNQAQSGPTTTGSTGDLYNRALTQNTGANDVMAGLANNNPISTGINWRDLGNTARDQAAPYASQIQGLFNNFQGANADANATLGGIQSGANGITTGNQYQSVADNAQGATAAEKWLTDMAGGGQGNPYLQQLLDTNANRARLQTGAAMSGAGRYGSAGHEAAAARGMAEATNPYLFQSYENDRNRQLSATGQIDQSRRAANAERLAGIGGLTQTQMQNISNQFNAANSLASNRRADVGTSSGLLGQGYGIENSALNQRIAALQGQTGTEAQNAALRQSAASDLANSNRADTGMALNAQQAGMQDWFNRMGLAQNATAGLTNVQGQNINNQFNAANSLFNQNQQGVANTQNWASMLPQLNNLQYSGANQLGNIGNFMQNYNQQGVTDQRQLWEQQNQMPWQQLQQYAGLVSPMGQLGSNMTGTQTAPGASTPWTQYAGLGLAGGSLFGSPAGGGPSAAANIGSTLGTLGRAALQFLPAFASDRNLKTDIRKLGHDDRTDLDMYAYRYKGDPKTYPKTVGPMAQDVERRYPGSTERVGGNLVIKGEAVGLLGL